ncbi:unnamed protein product [Nyctereutes procyonoides]|uniref:(raccoon dog) hypothetical protein n=2 Tax=Nyctereutes procyonoides TaxID=34880 RepID=A0A811YN14_NYCPR|nr:unnamed protein product [Nyctereutes procyonoides]
MIVTQREREKGRDKGSRPGPKAGAKLNFPERYRQWCQVELLSHPCNKLTFINQNFYKDFRKKEAFIKRGEGDADSEDEGYYWNATVRRVRASIKVGRRGKRNKGTKGLRGGGAPRGAGLRPGRGAKRARGPEYVFEQILAENFPNLGRETGIQIQEIERSPPKINKNHLEQIILRFVWNQKRPQTARGILKKENHIWGHHNARFQVVLQSCVHQDSIRVLMEEIMSEKENKTIVFVETKRRCDEPTRKMRRDGWPAMGIHGDKSQQECDWVLNEFKHGKAPILIATDVASRGLDVEDVKFVINYDYHKTARSTKTGTAYTFFTPNNIKQVSDLISVLHEANQAINPKLLQGRGGMKDDRGDRYFAGKGGGFNTFRDRENYDRGYSSLLKRDFGAKTQNGVYSAANYTNGSFGSNFVSAGIQTSFRTGNPTGTYQNGYDSTQQYGSNVPNMHNGMNQQACAYPATAAVPLIGYPMPTGYSQ